MWLLFSQRVRRYAALAATGTLVANASWGQEVTSFKPSSYSSTMAMMQEESAKAGPAIKTAIPIGMDASIASSDPNVAVDGVGSGRWTLLSLTERALQFHPAIAEIAARVDATNGQFIQAGLQANPSVGYQGQQIGSGGRAEQHGVTIGRDFIRHEKLARSQAVALAERNRLLQELETMRYRVRTEIGIAAINLWVAQKQYQLARDLYEVAANGEKLAQQLREAKEVSKIDVLQTSLEKEKASIAIDNAVHRVRASWQAIAALTGLNPDCPETVADEVADCQCQYTFCEVLSKVLASSPEIAAAQANIQKSHEVVARARVEPLPNVNVQALVNWQDNGIGGRPDGGVQVTVPIPTRNKNQGAIAQAVAELRAAEFALQKLELEIQARLAATFERYMNARSQEDRYAKSILPQAKESLELTRLAYKENDVTFLALLTAQRTYVEMSFAAVEAARQRRVAETEMDGMLLGLTP